MSGKPLLRRERGLYDDNHLETDIASDRRCVIQYFVIERFLYRWSTSKHRDQFVLKGALLFRVWTAEDSRATRAIDFLAYGDNSIDNLIEIVKEIIAVNDDDGIVFDLD